MNLLQILTNPGAADVFDFMAGAALKGALLIITTSVITRLWRRSSAAARHCLWVAILVGVLLLPIIGLLTPAWQMSVLPSESAGLDPRNNSTLAPQKVSVSLFPNNKPGSTKSDSHSETHLNSSATTLSEFNSKNSDSSITLSNGTFIPATALPIPWSRIGIFLWLLGMILILNRWRIQWQDIRRITQDGLIIADPSWRKPTNNLATENGLHCSIRLILSDQVAVPMTWGIWSPVILLPTEASHWPVIRRRVVLLHELAHIVRRDYLTQWLTLAICGLYWFNPAIWWAAQQIALEREQATDDRVLNSGIRNIEYANHLLEIASNARRNQSHGALGLALVRRSALAHRIRSILAPRSSRGRLANRHRLVLIGLIGCSLLPLSTVQLVPIAAQPTPQTVVLTIALPTHLKDPFNDSVLKDFQAANPGIQVHVTDTQNVASAAFGLDAHLAGLQKYASSADVLYIGDYQDQQVTAQATRAGYFLDLTPLTSTDASLKADDFIPAMWRSFQWDNGFWALPVNGSLYTLLYKPADFDKAGLTYPVNTWTASDFLTAVTKLTVKDAQGQVITPGFATTGGFSRAVMLRALAGANLFDTNTVPNPPALDQPNVEAALDTFSQMQSDGLIGGDPQVAPMSFLPATFTLVRGGADKYVATLLPGGTAYLETDGFAISAGTQHPDAAYALIRFLTNRPEFIGEGGLAARRTMAGPAPVKFPVDSQALIDQGLANAITNAELRFADYLRIANNNIGRSLDARTAILNAQSQATRDANIAASKKGTIVLTINEPNITTPPAGKITLNFDLSARSIPTIPTQTQWDQFLANFVAHDPLVASVNMTISDHSPAQAASHSDCFFLGYNAVPELNESSVLNLDPYLTADSSFDKSDLLGTVPAAVQRDNKTWALPLTVSPLVLVYDADKFKTADVPTPTGDWTVSAFVDALTHLKAISNPSG